MAPWRRTWVCNVDACRRVREDRPDRLERTSVLSRTVTREPGSVTRRSGARARTSCCAGRIWEPRSHGTERHLCKRQYLWRRSLARVPWRSAGARVLSGRRLEVLEFCCRSAHRGIGRGLIAGIESDDGRLPRRQNPFRGGDRRGRFRGATAPVASTKPDLGKSLARLVRAAARPREYERRVVAFFDSALVKGGAK